MPGAPEMTLLAPGQVIARCRVLRFLGRGGMGEVYLCEHLTLQKKVALKTLPPGSIAPGHVERFFKEARLGSKIEHPNVVRIYDVGCQGQLYYILMQYIEGQNLAELVHAQGGPLPWKLALRVIRFACKGLAAVHRHGVIHRDIKPSNIMVSNDSRVLVMDFGLAREESQSPNFGLVVDSGLTGRSSTAVRRTLATTMSDERPHDRASRTK